ncbi:signal recognition particle-docking protein FtsY [[Phormidium ambiguum] IAM M-71]|uniref:Signal recognition particle receptor FtsY n=1 Tax=[Phormidium ambiguum] IAM M-71 TaxID=454136 RepID=A0A1U7IH51_9CYAN|nr:signal recognition particle-docking protein FtsY [Phormidium ambiguum]OKH36354.1 signal recognition particle-docking protein FtsY [Phormidium ambiguum IAM M-71]
MVFNWFRRQYDKDKEKTEKQPETTPPPESKVESTQPSTTSEPQTSEDYLTWAKAAYKNIQAKQKLETATETTVPAEETTEETPVTETIVESIVTEEAVPETPVTETLPESVVTEAMTGEIPVTEKVPESVITGEIAPETPVTEIVTESVVREETALENPVIETIGETGDVVEEVAAAAEVETPVQVPFWARKEEREARIQKLVKDAIEEPEAEVSPAATVAAPETTLEEIPDFAFDEGFMWSAEILAAQGRRPEDVSIEEITWLKKLRQGLDKTRRNIVNQLKAIVGQGPLNQDAVEEIESLLLQADVGVEATDYIISSLQSKLREEVLPPDAAIAYLKQIIQEMLESPLQKSAKRGFAPEKDALNIWLMTGVNGAGKTTTIGKIAHIADKSGYKCLIAAADTFRAAAVQQVKVWGQRSNVEVVANPGNNTDPAAVVFDAISAAKSRGTELLLVDTAGRLQNKKNLMDELSKIRRIIDKKAPEAKIESLLVLDATLGQNGLRQAEVFAQTAQLSGVVLTKLDGTAKGGVALAVVKQLGLPIRFIGAGEGIEDLRPFSSYEFVEALLSG